MKKLTAEFCEYLLKDLQRQSITGCGIGRTQECYLQALEIALPILEQQERACQKCGGAGDVDSGAHTAGGRKVMVKCDCQFEQQERGDGWIEWGGGECPVAPWEVVSVKHRNDKCTSPDGPAYQFDWSNYPSKFDTDIIAYRIIPEQPTNQNGEQ